MFDIVFIACYGIFFVLLGASAMMAFGLWFTSRSRDWSNGRYFWASFGCGGAIFLTGMFCATGAFGRWNMQNGTLQIFLASSVATAIIIYFVREGTRAMAPIKGAGTLLIEADEQYRPYPALIVGMFYSGFAPGCILYGLSYVYPEVLSGYMPVARTLLLVAAILLAWDGFQHGRTPRGAQLPRRAVASAVGMGGCLMGFLFFLDWP